MESVTFVSAANRTQNKIRTVIWESHTRGGKEARLCPEAALALLFQSLLLRAHACRATSSARSLVCSCCGGLRKRWSRPVTWVNHHTPALPQGGAEVSTQRPRLRPLLCGNQLSEEAVPT